jgi:AraC family transcriptional regulator, alkane utilization regulator
VDPLSEVLRMVRLQGAFFLNAECHEPWCVEAPRAADMAPVLSPGARKLAILHLVLEGHCWIQLEGAEPLRVFAGEAVILPAGDAHVIGSGRGDAPPDRRHRVALRLPELAPVRYGGDGERTQLVCGWFAFERDIPNPLLANLPPLFRVGLAGRAAGPWIEQSVRYALHEAAAGEPGSTTVAAKVAESIFIEALRAYVESLPAHASGWLAGMRDTHVGRCLALMHAHPARDWSLEALGDEVHVSRSVLAERFTALVGLPPMQYLKRWRLALAARLLCSERCNLVRVAEAVGYESEASFSRAFKSEFGISPGAWRSHGPSDFDAAAGADGGAG